MSTTKLNFNIYDFWKYDDKTFEEVFPQLPRLIYDDARNDWAIPRPELYKSYKHYNAIIKDKIIKSNGSGVNGVSWMEVLGVSIHNRNEMIYYEELTRQLHYQYTLAKLYYKSKYVKEDLLHLAIKRFDEIMVGIEFPGYIQFNYDYKETNSLYGDYRYFLGDVYISLYDTRTNIKSGNLSIIHVSQTYDDGYHSRPSWDCTYQNEQNIRHMVKQFLKDME